MTQINFEVSVTQEDREAARMYVAEPFGFISTEYPDRCSFDHASLSKAFARHRLSSARPAATPDVAEHGWVMYGPDGEWHWAAIKDLHECVEDQRPATALEKALFNSIGGSTEKLRTIVSRSVTNAPSEQ